MDHCLQGFNVSLFAYGQTSAGKTHTMTGNLSDPGQVIDQFILLTTATTKSALLWTINPSHVFKIGSDARIVAQFGLAPRLLEHLFLQISEAEGREVWPALRIPRFWCMQQHIGPSFDKALHVCVCAQCRKSSWRCGVIGWQGPDKLKFTVKASYLELYKEVITDLLGPADGASLQLREDLCNGVYVEGLTEQEILNGALPWAEQSLLGAPSLVESKGDFFQRRL